MEVKEMIAKLKSCDWNKDSPCQYQRKSLINNSMKNMHTDIKM